ncbi:MAG TPA: GxxExxY protein [Vicinamibacterales bacterium]|nr:GxxExxY protein [Vicinamibacterales bacterium]
MSEFIRDPVVESIIGAAIRVHRELGPGLLESAYKACLSYEFIKLGLRFDREVPVPLEYEGVRLDCGYRLDLLVEGSIVVEVKSVEKLLPIHTAQVMTYLRLTGARHLLLFNFNCLALKEGLKSFVGKGITVPGVDGPG